MKGSVERGRTLKRARTKSSTHRFPVVPASLKALRQRDQLQYVRELIRFFRTSADFCHPLSEVGWWCRYEEQMKDLITFLSEPQSSHPDVWSTFRKEVSNQLSLCRQCAVAYHKAVSTWELSSEVSNWPKVVIRKRVTELVEWDAHRLIPAIEKGAVRSRSPDDPSYLAERTQCREAFLEALLSIRLCMNETFCEVLNNVFRIRSPVGNHEEVTRFAKANGVIPPGVAALCFHSSEHVRKWAKSAYASCRSQFPADEQAAYLLITKGLRLAVTKASATSDSHSSESVAWAPDLQCLWEGLDTLLTSVSVQELESIIKRNKKFAIMEAIFASLTNAGRDPVTKSHGLPEVRSSLRYILLRTSFASLFGYCNLNPEKLLDAIFTCLKVRIGDSSDRRLLLDMLFSVASASMRRENRSSSKGLFMKCFSFLEALERLPSTTPNISRQSDAFNVAEGHNSRDDILSTGARLLHKFYWHSWPRLPVDDSKRIAEFVTKIVRRTPGREYSWDLLRSILLTDVFNLLRCIYESREVEMIATAFFSFHAHGRPAPEKRFAALEAAVRGTSESQVSLVWVEDLWKNVREGHHVSDDSQLSKKVRDFEIGLALDLHRLVGVLDPRRCGDLVKNEVLKPSGTPHMAGDSATDLVYQRVEFVHDTIVSRMKMTSHLSDHCMSIKELPFHAAHLLSSSRSEVSKQTVLLLQKRCKIQNATYAKPQSQDKVLVHILEQNKGDACMVFDGFMSATRIKSAQGAAVSVRAYPSFFRWYSLLTSRDCPILQGREIAKGALGVLLSFLENWRTFELRTNTETFRETVCRLFSVIPGIWNTLFDTEDKSESKTIGNVDRYRQEVSPWTRKVATKLLTMHDLKDEVAFGAWIRMITHDVLKATLKSIDSSRGIVMEAINERERRQLPLECVQYRQLAQAFDLEETEQILDKWSWNESGKNSSLTAKSTTVKNYRDTKIDSFFPVRFCKSRPLGWNEGCAASALNEVTRDHRLQIRMAVAQRSQTGHCSIAPERTNGSLHDLRRDHRQARAELRRAVSAYETVSANHEPTKTRFEMLREQRIAAKERKKSQVQGDVASEVYPEQAQLQRSMDDMRSELVKERSAFPVDLPEDLNSEGFCYPVSRRDLATPSIEQIKRDVLMSCNPHPFEAETYASCPPRTFDSVESYVKYWEPLLIAEFRAGMRKKLDEERFFAEQKQRDQENTGCQAVFEVDGPVEDIGYLHTLSITSLHRNGTSLQSHASVGITAFDVSGIQVSDIVMLEIPRPLEVLHADRKNVSDKVFAIVSAVLRSKKGLRLMLHVVFDNAWAPGKGRVLKVSKLLSFTTLQRQLDALWSLPKTHDGILWSLLDPLEGWRLKRDLEARNEALIDRNSSLPLGVIQKMETLGILNASQGRALAAVVRSCSYLFAARGGGTRSQYTKHNHGGVSLIQGPPGTGKTTTIIALLSALLSCLESNPYRRKAKVILDGTPHILSVPAIRILVCAPSNAAIDEVMLRVMNDGLFTASENRFCPRLVRVGRGTTVEALRVLEVHSLSKSGDEQPCSKVSSANTDSRDHHKLLEEVSKSIAELEADRRKIASQLERPPDESGIIPNLSKPDADTFREIGEKLDILYDKKKLLHSILFREREAAEKDEASRRRESMKRVCNTLAAASVVFATLSSSGHEDMKSLGVKFDVVIVDEAGQSCEPESLIPIMLGQQLGSPKQRFVHAVLVGDPKQLPATVISNNRRVASAMGQSLFERIGLCDPSIVHVLDTQYRMHPKISLFPSERFYEGLLQNSTNVQDQDMRKAWHFDERKRFGPLTIFDTAHRTAKETRSREGSLSNEMEAKVVIEGLVALFRLYGTEGLHGDVTILSPYKQQVLLLRRLVSSNAELLKAKVEVSTIDGIQGREKSVVLLSTVRSGHSKDIGFVKDDRRLNVALTRAKHTLMIFGHTKFLSAHSDTWAALLFHCRKHSQVVSLSDGHHTLFPESQRVFRPRIPKERSQVEKSSDIVHDEHVNELPVEGNALRGTNSLSDLNGRVLGKQPSRGAGARRTGQIEKLSSREANADANSDANLDEIRKHRDEKTSRYGREAQHQYYGFHDRLATNTSTVLSKTEHVGNRSQLSRAVYPIELDLKRVLSESKKASQDHGIEKQKGAEPHLRLTQLNSSSPVEGLSRRGDQRKNEVKPRGLRPQVDVLVKTRGYPPHVRESFATLGRRVESRGGFNHSGEPPLPRSSSCGVQRPVQIGLQKGQDRVVKKSLGGVNTGRKRANLSTTPTKCSYSFGPELLLRNEPPRKKSRLDKERHESHRNGSQGHGNQKRGNQKRGNPSAERKHVALRRACTKQNVTDFRATPGVLQTKSSLQTRKQPVRKVVTHYQNRTCQNREREGHLPNLDVKYQSRTRSSRTAPGFSLADTQSKLKGTLDSVRNARDNPGTHR